MSAELIAICGAGREIGPWRAGRSKSGREGGVGGGQIRSFPAAGCRCSVVEFPDNPLASRGPLLFTSDFIGIAGYLQVGIGELLC
jgi:hypothetical protein